MAECGGERPTTLRDGMLFVAADVVLEAWKSRIYFHLPLNHILSSHGNRSKGKNAGGVLPRVRLKFMYCIYFFTVIDVECENAVFIFHRSQLKGQNYVLISPRNRFRRRVSRRSCGADD